MGAAWGTSRDWLSLPHPHLETCGGRSTRHSDYAGLLVLGEDEDGILADDACHKSPSLGRKDSAIEFHDPRGLSRSFVDSLPGLKTGEGDTDRFLLNLLKARGDRDVSGAFQGFCDLRLRSGGAAEEEEEKDNEPDLDDPIVAADTHRLRLSLLGPGKAPPAYSGGHKWSLAFNT